MKVAYNVFDPQWNEHAGVFETADLNTAFQKLTDDGFRVIHIEQAADDAAIYHNTLGPADEDVLAEVEQFEEQEEQPLRRNERLQRRQVREIPWGKIGLGVAIALAIIAILYAVANNNRAQRKAIEALEAKIASLANNPNQPQQPPPSAPQVAAPAGAVPPPGITATNLPPQQSQQPLRIQGPPPGTAATYQIAGTTGGTSGAPLVNVVVDNRWRFNASGGGTMTNAAGAGQDVPGDTRLLALAGQGNDYLTFPTGTRIVNLIIPQNATTNAPTVWVVMPNNADRYEPQVGTDIFVQTLFADQSVGEWMKMSPVASLPFTASPIRAMRFAVANPNTPVPFTIRFRGL